MPQYGKRKSGVFFAVRVGFQVCFLEISQRRHVHDVINIVSVQVTITVGKQFQWGSKLQGTSSEALNVTSFCISACLPVIQPHFFFYFHTFCSLQIKKSAHIFNPALHKLCSNVTFILKVGCHLEHVYWFFVACPIRKQLRSHIKSIGQTIKLGNVLTS